MNRAQKNVIFIVIIVGMILFLHHFYFEQYLTIGAIKEYVCGLQVFADQYYWQSVIIYLCIYIGLVACTLPVVLPCTLLGGLLFGLSYAVFYSIISVTVGSLITFLLVRYLLRVTVKEKYTDQLKHFNKRIHDYGADMYLILLHFMTVIPLFIINVLAALADVPVVTFVWTSVVGSLPIIFVYAFAGKQLCVISSMQDIFSPSMIMLLVSLIAIIFLVLIARRFQKRL